MCHDFPTVQFRVNNYRGSNSPLVYFHVYCTTAPWKYRSSPFFFARVRGGWKGKDWRDSRCEIDPEGARASFLPCALSRKRISLRVCNTRWNRTIVSPSFFFLMSLAKVSGLRVPRCVVYRDVRANDAGNSSPGMDLPGLDSTWRGRLGDFCGSSKLDGFRATGNMRKSLRQRVPRCARQNPRNP